MKMADRLYDFLASCSALRQPLSYTSPQMLPAFENLLKVISHGQLNNDDNNSKIHVENGDKYGFVYLKLSTGVNGERNIYVGLEALCHHILNFFHEYEETPQQLSPNNIPAFLVACGIILGPDLHSVFSNVSPNSINPFTLTVTSRPTPEQRLVAARIVSAIPNIYNMLPAFQTANNPFQLSQQTLITILVLVCAPELFFTSQDTASIDACKAPLYSLDITSHLSLSRAQMFLNGEITHTKANLLVNAILEFASVFPLTDTAKTAKGHFVDVLQTSVIPADQKSSFIAVHLGLLAPAEKSAKKIKMSDTAHNRGVYHVSLAIESAPPSSALLTSQQQTMVETMCPREPSVTVDHKLVSYCPKRDGGQWVFRMARLSELVARTCNKSETAAELDKHGHGCLLQGFLSRALVSKGDSYMCGDVYLYLLYLYAQDDAVVEKWRPVLLEKSRATAQNSDEIQECLSMTLAFCMVFNKHFLSNTAVNALLSEEHAVMLIKILLYLSLVFKKEFKAPATWFTDLHSALEKADVKAFERVAASLVFTIRPAGVQMSNWTTCRESLLKHSVPLVIPVAASQWKESSHLFVSGGDGVVKQDDDASCKDFCRIMSFVEFYYHGFKQWSLDGQYARVADLIREHVLNDDAVYPIYRRHGQLYKIDTENGPLYSDVIYHPECDFILMPIHNNIEVSYAVESTLRMLKNTENVKEKLISINK
jgi:hypothetical protein